MYAEDRWCSMVETVLMEIFPLVCMGKHRTSLISYCQGAFTVCVG